MKLRQRREKARQCRASLVLGSWFDFTSFLRALVIQSAWVLTVQELIVLNMMQIR